VVEQDHGYENGLRDGKIRSLEKAVEGLTVDMNKMKIALWMLYGAIALVQFLPELKGFMLGTP
jgi:hypothetical protein